MLHPGGIPDLLQDQMMILLGALLLDITVGDPREDSLLEKLHPVVWMGALTAAVDRRTPRGRPGMEKTVGILLVFVVTGVFSLPSLLLYPLREASRVAYIVSSVLLLKSSFTVKGLRRYVLDTLEGSIDERRRKVARIVSRDTSSLGEAELNSAAIESAAENLTDSLVSPLLFFALFGIPGALFYRAVNTLDAMVGYRDARYRYLGQAAATLDRVVNAIPEWIASLLILLCGGGHSDRVDKGPWPRTIGAMATVLGVNLRKPGVYEVAPESRDPEEADVRRAVAIVTRASPLVALLAVLTLILVHMGGWTWWSSEVLSLM
jgi:adenosylcobinamide-phosphate synthase